MSQHDSSASVPTTLRGGKWRLEGELGQGGMATVFAATHRNGMRGAIKLLHMQYSKDEKIRSRLLREGYLANRIRHPGIVKVLDDDVTDDGRVFLVMELLTGKTLKARWTEAGGRLPPNEALDVCDSVLDVLTAAHAEGVVHRDVKPDNVFLTADGVVKVLDFGIAGIKESAGDMTHTSEMLGTPAFMSPEQALAHWHDVDARSDLFAVGAMLFTLLSGELVHRARTLPELLVAAATKPARSLSTVLPEAAPVLVGVVDKALAFQPSDRWQTADEMRAALQRARAALRPGTVRLDQSDAPDDLKAAIAGHDVARADVVTRPLATHEPRLVGRPAATLATDPTVEDGNATVELESPFSPPQRALAALPIETAPTLAATLQSAAASTRTDSSPGSPVAAAISASKATMPLLEPIRGEPPSATMRWQGLDPTHHEATRSVRVPTPSRGRVVAMAWIGGVVIALAVIVSVSVFRAHQKGTPGDGQATVAADGGSGTPVESAAPTPPATALQSAPTTSATAPTTSATAPTTTSVPSSATAPAKPVGVGTHPRVPTTAKTVPTAQPTNPDWNGPTPKPR